MTLLEILDILNLMDDLADGKQLTKILKSSEQVKQAVMEELGLLAIDVYRQNMLSVDEKIRKSAADSVMEIIVGKEGQPIQGIAFNFPAEALKSALNGLKKVAEAPKVTLKEVK